MIRMTQDGHGLSEHSPKGGVEDELMKVCRPRSMSEEKYRNALQLDEQTERFRYLVRYVIVMGDSTG